MFIIDNFYLFISVSLLVNLSPGPDMLYTAARSLSQGIKAGIFSTLGIFTGCLFHISAAVFGLSKIIEESVLLFSIIKYAGAGYLIYLGLKSLLKKSKSETKFEKLSPLSYRKIFSQGLFTNLLNPKVAIFFLSFLPQFINPYSHYLKEQIAFLGLWFDVQGCIILIAVAMLTGTFRKILLRNKNFWNWQEKITGMILVGLGIRMFFSKK
ncbi:MAG TPA: LysE family translocator [Chitinophagaceae bacterium]|nr:LysE family translocator [Chitinophagaceae bacterium]